MAEKNVSTNVRSDAGQVQNADFSFLIFMVESF